MQRHVDRELVRARIETGRPVARPLISVEAVADRVVRTLRRTPKGEALSWSLSVPEDAQAPIDPDDLAELLGNLLENGCKWARHEVRLVAKREPDWIHITVADDGPGVPAGKVAELGRRGVRLDEHVQGSGQGLAIVGDIVAAYGGRLEIGNGEVQGLRVDLWLPVGSTPQEPV
jgi:signal transduction histidine kinase